MTYRILKPLSPGHLPKLAERNPNWKGNSVGLSSLHEWVNKRKGKLKICSNCGIEKPRLDLANISGNYLRDLSDWEYLCRKCHMTKDGRRDRFLALNHSRNKRQEITCPGCKRIFKQTRPVQKYCKIECYWNKGKV